MGTSYERGRVPVAGELALELATTVPFDAWDDVDPDGEPLDSLVMEARDRLTNIGLFVVWGEGERGGHGARPRRPRHFHGGRHPVLSRGGVRRNGD